MKSSRSWLTLGLIPAVLLGMLVLPFALFWSDIPNPMATHWGLGGDPNGSMPPIVLLLLMAGLTAAVWWGVARAVGRTPYEAPSFVAGLFGIETLLVAVTWLSVLTNRDETTWQDADSVGLLQIAMAVIPAMILGYIGWIISGGSGMERTPASEAIPSLDVSSPHSALWSSRGQGRILQAIGVIVLVVAIAMWGWASFAVVLIALIVLVFAEVRVTVSQNGAVISLGWLGIPSWTVPISAIAHAEVETVNPMAYGGFGYRLRPGVRAIVTRGGEALRLVREEMPDLVLTVDDAETGAGLINSMLGVHDQDSG